MTRLPFATYPHFLMSEYAATFPREWFEFSDPENPNRLFKCDLTWLTSYWNCIFGRGCQGIEKELPDHGCCSDGAYYFDKNDEMRVTAAAERLTPQMWQNYSKAHASKRISISEIGLDRDRKTRRINKSCVFFNDSSFDSKYFGCALHHLADQENKHYAETKPDICWQLPLRRSWESREIGDSSIEVVVIGEYTREAWGEGGADFDWYCSSNSEAHNAQVPIYKSHREELTRMMSPAAYQVLHDRCELIVAARNIRKFRSLPLFVIHPASSHR